MIRSVNPYTSEAWAEWSAHSSQQVQSIIERAHQHHGDRRMFAGKAKELAKLLREHKATLASCITQEMGKPIAQSIQEIEKCAWCCDYYAAHAEAFLQDEQVITEYYQSYISYEAVGIWLAIMPWNFPFWQVFRCAIPALAAGNNIILKHASNVQSCAHEIQELFYKAGFETYEFQNIIVSGKDMDEIVAHPYIHGISLTGSEEAGMRVAAIAGKTIKPIVLELGGSNAFIVTETADITRAVEDVIIGRFQNNGQSCIAAKRLLVADAIYDAFLEQLLSQVQALQCGDPALESTFIGPLAKPSFNVDLMDQVNRSVQEGATLLHGGVVQNGIFQPTLLTNVTTEMVCMREELFGPVLPVFRYTSIEEAIAVSNSTSFGLGVSIYGDDLPYIQSLIPHFKEGAVFINSIVKSDPRLPFGGTKRSGIGRELGKAGLLEFVNTKTIVINN